MGATYGCGNCGRVACGAFCARGNCDQPQSCYYDSNCRRGNCGRVACGAACARGNCDQPQSCYYDSSCGKCRNCDQPQSCYYDSFVETAVVETIPGPQGPLPMGMVGPRGVPSAPLLQAQGQTPLTSSMRAQGYAGAGNAPPVNMGMPQSMMPPMNTMTGAVRPPANQGPEAIRPGMPGPGMPVPGMSAPGMRGPGMPGPGMPGPNMPGVQGQGPRPLMAGRPPMVQPNGRPGAPPTGFPAGTPGGAPGQPIMNNSYVPQMVRPPVQG